jgi:hypothetical protein
MNWNQRLAISWTCLAALGLGLLAGLLLVWSLQPAHAGDRTLPAVDRHLVSVREESLLQRQEVSHAGMRSAGTAVCAYILDHGSCPGPTDDYVEAEFLRPYLEPSYLANLPARDGWGNPVLYRCDGRDFRLVSNGADGRADRPYDEVRDRARTEGLEADIIWENKVFLRQPARLAVGWDPSEATVGSIQSIGAACDAYARDHGALPGPTDGLEPVAALREVLEPTYIANLPANDGWGRPILYRAWGRGYRLVSRGDDGQSDAHGETLVIGAPTDPHADIVYENGNFLIQPSVVW